MTAIADLIDHWPADAGGSEVGTANGTFGELLQGARPNGGTTRGCWPSRNVTALGKICRAVGGLGLVACHGGTMVGILLDPRDADYQSRLSDAVQLAEELLGRTHLYRTLAA